MNDVTLSTGIVEINVVKANLPRLVALRLAAEIAADDYNNGCKTVAGRAGIKESALKKFVTARAGEKFEEKKAECEQLYLLFEELPA